MKWEAGKETSGQITEPAAEDFVREFGFLRDEEGQARTIRVKKHAPFHELPEAVSFKGALALIDAFEKARMDTRLSDGRTLTRRPHLLMCGGFVRDSMMGASAKDIDFATNLDYEAADSILRGTLKEEIERGEVDIVETGKAFGVIRVRFKNLGEEYEIASFRSDGDYTDGRRPDSIAFEKHAGTDANRRDLSINALFYNPRTGNIIDYVGGIEDIERKTLRFVGDPEKRINEDKLRSLRYVRFLLRTGFAEDQAAKQTIIAHMAETAALPADRIRDELVKIFKSASAGEALERCKEYEVLRHMLPEVEALSSCEQGPPYHMEGNVFRHTVMVCNALPQDASAELRIGAMLHDIGKPATRAEEGVHEGRKVSFLGHEELSAEMAAPLLNRLRFSNKEKEKILWLIENHLRIFAFADMREAKARQFAASEHFEELVALAEADIRSSYADDPKITESNIQLIGRIRERLAQIREFEKSNSTELDAIKKAVNGRVIIERYKERYGKPPAGKMIGSIKEATLEKITEQKITSVDDALAVLQSVVEDAERFAS